MRISLVILLLGFVGCLDAIGWHVPSYVLDPNSENRDPHGIHHAFHGAMTDLWDRHTVYEGGENTTFSLNIDPTLSIQGKVMSTNLGRTIYAYEGFKFGQTPDRDSKFRPPKPEPFPNWNATQDPFMATHMGHKCPQGSMIGPAISGKIDCLYLNVFTPYVPKSDEFKASKDADTGLPVMFFVYGGAFTTGDASMYLPTKLLDHDVILVTIHYRLGAQGFFTLNNADAPGNTAIYDQIEALRWVNNNIAEFSGNPNQITVFGESAGSVSVNYLMISPLTAGLLQGVLAESGSSLDNWAVDADPGFAADSVATYVGCKTENGSETDAEIFECMLHIPDDDLVHAEGHLVGNDRHNGFNGFRGASPIIQQDKSVIDIDPVINMHPREYFYSGNFNKVPFMTGSNRQEGSFVIGIMYGDYFMYNHLDTNETWMREQMVQQMLLSSGIRDDTHVLDKILTDHFCKDLDMGDMAVVMPCLIDMMGALFLKGGSWETVNLHSYYADELSRFYYSFEFESDDTMYLWLLPEADWDTGITHSDELMYIFSMPAVMEEENGQILTEKRMTLMWTNFARYGDPTPDEAKEEWMALGLPKWESFKFEEPHYMTIEDEWHVGNEFSERWTISYDAIYNNHASTYMPSTQTMDPDSYISQEEYDDLKKERDAYMATMIVFIILFVIAVAGAIYLFMKNR